MRLGINLMAWSATVGPAERALFPVLAALGYEGVELPLFHPAAFDPGPVREALQASGLECTLACALPEGASLLVPDAQPAALAFLRQCLGVARALVVGVLGGPLYAPANREARQPLMAPARIPSIRRRWKIKKSTMSGSVARTPPANII